MEPHCDTSWLPPAELRAQDQKRSWICRSLGCVGVWVCGCVWVYVGLPEAIKHASGIYPFQHITSKLRAQYQKAILDL